MTESQNICGVAIYLAPDAGEELTAKILALPGVELQAVSGECRLAATIVDTSVSMAIDQIAAIHRLPGVVAASLIYHAVDTPDDACENTCEDDAACRAPACGQGHAGMPLQQPKIR